MEKYHNVEKIKKKNTTENMITNFSEKLRNFSIYIIYNNNSDFLEAYNNLIVYLCTKLYKIIL